MRLRQAVVFAFTLLSTTPLLPKPAQSPRPDPWRQQSSGTMSRLRGISAADEKTAWASGANGSVLRTIDGGAQWQAVTTPAAADLDFRDVHAVNASTAFVLSIGEGEKSRIYKTTDAGRTWSLLFTNRNPKAFFDGFAFWDSNNGIAFSDPVDGRFLIIRTADGGANWKEIPRDSMPLAVEGEAGFAASGTSIVAAGTNDVWIATGGAAARVLHSTDRGLTWSAAVTPIVSGAASAGIFSIYAASSQLVFVVGGDYTKENESTVNFARSTDGGKTWIAGPRLSGYRSAIHAARFGNRAGYVAAGPSGTDFLAAGESSWTAVSKTGYDALSFANGGETGWGAGAAGRVGRWQPR